MLKCFGVMLGVRSSTTQPFWHTARCAFSQHMNDVEHLMFSALCVCEPTKWIQKNAAKPRHAWAKQEIRARMCLCAVRAQKHRRLACLLFGRDSHIFIRTQTHTIIITQLCQQKAFSRLACSPRRVSMSGRHMGVK